MVRIVRTALIMLLPVLVSIYTISFGRYNWRQGNKLGAVGVFGLAVGSVAVPLLVIILKQQ